MPEIKFLSNYNSIERHPKGLPASDRGGVTNDSPRQVKSRSCMKHEREGKPFCDRKYRVWWVGALGNRAQKAENELRGWTNPN